MILQLQIEYANQTLKARLNMPVDQTFLTDKQKEEEKKVQAVCSQFVAACDYIKGKYFEPHV